MRLSANEQAQYHYERALDLLGQVSEPESRRRLELESLTELATVQSMLYGGASSQVEQTLTRAHNLDLRKPGHEVARFRLLEGLWEVHFQRGEIRKSCRLAQSCLEIAEALQLPHLLVDAHCALGSALYRLGNMARSHRHQQSRCLELRATTSLCKLWLKLGRSNQAWRELSKTFAWFTEGFDTPDLVSARDLLDQIQAEPQDP